ncbi:phosphopantothenoylcysteine decarboxylase / phosphopantothenate--cysteine ligase [Ekhidna lutea]|uniref:Coenzyme A biosynthesis bifunctional protein CoaBC n=1 Tax=Ekhidna lutea TaxID=447679 RepID=A0A239M751_EKHLU|nr:bifunctional phosphopantothenoylcysteine decarboxylase/phosphopantothenate--cysteine ligase CoaBC [Ekhidna lutea]SNT37679.1 phosphopantothenoylcysteine decarboxylase / phosphopantothenate--cysteine ligase [Ekhidna lutea]
MLAGKKILLAVCGSIAAYKTAFFVRLLKKEGAEVKVIMTESAKDFITPLTLATLSKNPVFSEYFNKESGEWHNHVELGMWADLMLIAPLSANTLGKMANGICDNLLLATYLSAKCPVMVAPAMDLDMYQHPSTKENLKKLQSFGNEVIEARDGELASGLSGQGRMAEPEELLEIIKKKFESFEALRGKRVLITSGPTFEAIDPVRFIGNHSSGKMGTAIAKAFQNAGAETTMISGPADYFPDHGNLIKVQSANEMLAEAEKHYSEADIVIFSAAVSDYRPENPATEKIKKKDDTLQVNLVKNPDIAAELGKKKKNQFHIGFALETNNEEVNAKEKLKKKNFDLIVLNSLNDNGAGFQRDTNKVTFFDNNNNTYKFELKSKTDVATDIVDYVIKNLK